MKKEKHLTPTQLATKRPRPLVYSGPDANYAWERGDDIVSCYVTFGLGYSPIRHILGEKNEKNIERCICQHSFGRANVKPELGELYCPQQKTISDLHMPLIVEMCKKYDTLNDPYIQQMITTKTWYSDNDKPKKCKFCGHMFTDGDKFCANCGKKVGAKPITEK